MGLGMREQLREKLNRMKFLEQAKPNKISKREVYEAWKAVKANKGAKGVDGESIEEFESKLSRNLYRLWNRMSSGSYFPKAVRRVEIPKKDGSKRPLGIPAVCDRVAQEVVRRRLEEVMEPLFHEDSYGYRPKKSAIDAVRVCRERNWKYDWVLDVDIRKFFDTIDHELLLKALRVHAKENWEVLYVERWLKAPVQYPDGRLEVNTKGTPQGGVISPLLANLFLHYAFDKWMTRNHPAEKFERFADDVVIHCRSLEVAEELKRQLTARLEECHLTLHPDKTKIVYCKDSVRRKEYPAVSYRFLGYTFQPRAARNRKTGNMFTSFLPAASTEAKKALAEKLKAKTLRRCVTMTVQEVSAYLNPTLRGWFGYFEHFCPSTLSLIRRRIDWRLIKWARDKKRWTYRKAAEWLARLKRQKPKMFAHWAMLSPSSGSIGRAG